MIKSFKHKGLERLFRTGNSKGVQQAHVNRLRVILNTLDMAISIDDLRLPGLNLHSLKGDLQGHHSVKVSGNWRVTFTYEDGHAEIVDYQDYH